MRLRWLVREEYHKAGTVLALRKVRVLQCVPEERASVAPANAAAKRRYGNDKTG